MGETFRTAPAATMMHHAYRHGLLEHTVHMARACKALLPLYPEVDPELAMAGILLHDAGKTIEYEGALSDEAQPPRASSRATSSSATSSSARPASRQSSTPRGPSGWSTSS